MLIQTIEDFKIWESDGHGKNTKGNKKTTGIQVRQYMPGGGYILLKTVNVPMFDEAKRKAAIEKCKEYIKTFIE